MSFKEYIKDDSSINEAKSQEWVVLVGEALAKSPMKDKIAQKFEDWAVKYSTSYKSVSKSGGLMGRLLEEIEDAIEARIDIE